MIVVMRRGAEQSHIEAVLRRIEVDTQPVHVFHGEERVVIAILGEAPSDELGEALEVLPGVEQASKRLAARLGRTDLPAARSSRSAAGFGSVQPRLVATSSSQPASRASDRRPSWSSLPAKQKAAAPASSGLVVRRVPNSPWCYRWWQSCAQRLSCRCSWKSGDPTRLFHSAPIVMACWSARNTLKVTR
jgi:hypothetical protein